MDNRTPPEFSRTAAIIISLVTIGLFWLAIGILIGVHLL